MGTLLIDRLIWAQEQLLGVSRDIQLVWRFSKMGLSGRSEELVMHLAQEVDLEGDSVHPEDEEEFWSATK